MTNCGQGEPTQSSGVTMEAPPSPPVGVAIILATPSSLIVQWGDSMQPNGIILQYKVSGPLSVLMRPVIDVHCNSVYRSTAPLHLQHNLSQPLSLVCTWTHVRVWMLTPVTLWVWLL